MHAVAAAVPQPPQLLDIHVDQLTGVGPLIAANHGPGRAVDEDQVVEVVTDQDSVNGGGRPVDQGTDPGRAELASAAQPADMRLDLGGHPPWVAAGGARPILQPGWAMVAVTGPPAIGAGAGDPHLGGDVGDWPATGDALAQDRSSSWGQASVSVGHEDLRLVSRQTAQPRRRSSPPVNNPHAQYS